ncbi:MAG TPA: hypothetical protein VMS77_06085 [Conexivisphaerales archaeon]|nr:hypothetical protein [Conexivisphaerales archaeon]
MEVGVNFSSRYLQPIAILILAVLVGSLLTMGLILAWFPHSQTPALDSAFAFLFLGSAIAFVPVALAVRHLDMRSELADLAFSDKEKLITLGLESGQRQISVRPKGAKMLGRLTLNVKTGLVSSVRLDFSDPLDLAKTYTYIEGKPPVPGPSARLDMWLEQHLHRT